MKTIIEKRTERVSGGHIEVTYTSIEGKTLDISRGCDIVNFHSLTTEERESTESEMKKWSRILVKKVLNKKTDISWETDIKELEGKKIFEHYDNELVGVVSHIETTPKQKVFFEDGSYKMMGPLSKGFYYM